MINNKNINNEEERNIYFFDIDETLFHTYAKILIKNTETNEIIKSLTNSEFNGYKLKENEAFDFQEFKSASIFKDSSPIKSTIERLKKIQSDINNEVYLLTARANFDNPKELLDFFKSHGINVGHKNNKGEIHILRSGEMSNKEKIPTEEAKFRYVKNIILEKKDIKKQNLYFFDDYFKNVSNMIKIANDFDISKSRIIVSYRGEVVEHGKTVKQFLENNYKHVTNLNDRNHIKTKYADIINTAKINNILKNISYKIYDKNELNSFFYSIKDKVSSQDLKEITNIVKKNINLYIKTKELNPNTNLSLQN